MEIGEAYSSSVWALAAEGKPIAERIAADLLGFAWAVIWSHEVKHVCVQYDPEAPPQSPE
ncbi:hypothetical protein WCLP8_2120005 [uncultured Gammaproteobacteria bacterium]